MKPAPARELERRMTRRSFLGAAGAFAIAVVAGRGMRPPQGTALRARVHGTIDLQWIRRTETNHG